MPMKFYLPKQAVGMPLSCGLLTTDLEQREETPLLDVNLVKEAAQEMVLTGCAIFPQGYQFSG